MCGIHVRFSSDQVMRNEYISSPAYNEDKWISAPSNRADIYACSEGWRGYFVSLR